MMKRIITFTLALLVTMTALPSASVSANQKPLSTDKTEYSVGEAIMVTAAGTGKDWVGIYKKGEAPGDKANDGAVIPSIYWYYVAEGGNTSSATVQIQKTTKNDRADLVDIPAGEYTIYLCENDGYKVLSSVNIKVTGASAAAPAAAPNAPLKVAYTRTATQTGYADGSVTVEPDTAGAKATDIVLYFADAQGPIKGYSSLAKQKVAESTVRFDMVKSTLIPAGATRLLAYASNDGGLSASYAECPLPTNASSYDFDKPIYELQVISDTHVTGIKGHTHNKNFEAMLKDVAANSPDSSGLFIAGDLVDKGVEEEYINLMNIYNSVANAPKMHWVIGNHDVSYSGTYDSQIELFNKHSGNTSAYYDLWLNDAHFIFLASEEAGLTAKISDEQFTWLRQKLAEKYTAGRPIFVFLHQSIYNTVAGSLEGQNWDGVGKEGVNDAADVMLKSILAKYPEAMLFTGHSHWELNSAATMYERSDKMCTAFNTASNGYLWTSYNDLHSPGGYYNKEKGGSHGYYVNVYDDKVLVLGRDFEKGEWLPSAMFCVDYASLKPAAGDSTKVPPETKGNNEGKTGAKTGLILALVLIAAGIAAGAAVIVVLKNRPRK